MTYDWMNEQILFLLSSDEHPSVGDLARHVKLAKSTVHDRLRGLKEEGLVTSEKGQHRSYRLTELGKDYIKANYG